MLALYLRIRNWLEERQEGQDLIEYALLVALIAIVVAALIPGVTNAIGNVFGDIADNLNTAPD